MVVVHRASGFRFVIYTFDHEPAHVHVTGAGRAKSNQGVELCHARICGEL
ncbi:MAG: DUF4160 domain-containing protein [Janthinobacterium lividum]